MSITFTEYLASIEARVADAMTVAEQNGISPAAAVAAAVAVMLETERTAALSPVIEFINDRPNFIVAMRNCPGADADYYRWSGHAEARRVLAGKLNMTVPHEPGETTKLVEPILSAVVNVTP